MANFRTEHRKINVSEYQYLREITDWACIEDEVVSIGLENDLFSICVFRNKELVGMGRVIGDGAMYFYIQDVIVLPKYRGKGVGEIIMQAIEGFLKKTAKRNAFIGLMAAKNVSEFYRKFGYQERPKKRPGMYKTVDRKKATP